MSYITEKQYKSLTDKIYTTLISMPDMGIGEMGDCRDESERIVDEWMENNEITWLVPLPEFGCGVTVQGGVLFYCPMMLDESLDLACLAEVTEPQSQEFLDRVNSIFKTEYKL